MFKIFKLFIKYKLSSQIKDVILSYSREKEEYVQRIHTWSHKIYEGKCETKEQFEHRRKEQILWCHEQSTILNGKIEVVLEILKIIESL